MFFFYNIEILHVTANFLLDHHVITTQNIFEKSCHYSATIILSATFITKITEAMAHDEKNRTNWQNHTLAALISSYNPSISLPCPRTNGENFLDFTSSTIDCGPYVYAGKGQTQSTDNTSVEFSCHHVSSSEHKLDLSNNVPHLPPSDYRSLILHWESILVHGHPPSEILSLLHYVVSKTSLHDNGVTAFAAMAYSLCCPPCYGPCCPYVRPCCGQCCSPQDPCIVPFCCPYRQSPCFGNCGPCGPCGPCGRCGYFQGPLKNVTFSPVPVTGLPLPKIINPLINQPLNLLNT